MLRGKPEALEALQQQVRPFSTCLGLELAAAILEARAAVAVPLETLPRQAAQ
jgi:hypothetical protein